MNANDIWLIAGLGNPEAKYEGTRHNAGFAALDSLAGKWGISVSKTKFQGLWGQGEVDGHKVVLLKPLTYMNLSGDSIAPLAGFFKIPADHVIVLCDDITQAPGKLRIRPSGSAGGHNGLKSIIARLGGENFPRIRIGIGRPYHNGVPTWDGEHVMRYVLVDPPKQGRLILDEAVERVKRIIVGAAEAAAMEARAAREDADAAKKSAMEQIQSIKSNCVEQVAAIKEKFELDTASLEIENDELHATVADYLSQLKKLDSENNRLLAESAAKDDRIESMRGAVDAAAKAQADLNVSLLAQRDLMAEVAALKDRLAASEQRAAVAEAKVEVMTQTRGV